MIWLVFIGVAEAVAGVVLLVSFCAVHRLKEENDVRALDLYSQRGQLFEEIHEFKNSKSKAGMGKKLRARSNKAGHDAAKAALGSLDPDLIAALTARDA